MHTLCDVEDILVLKIYTKKSMKFNAEFQASMLCCTGELHMSEFLIT